MCRARSVLVLCGSTGLHGLDLLTLNDVTNESSVEVRMVHLIVKCTLIIFEAMQSNSDKLFPLLIDNCKARCCTFPEIALKLDART